MRKLQTEAAKKVRMGGDSVRGTSLRFLFVISLLFMAGCTAKPNAGIAEVAIREHFKQKGYLITEVSIGNISRNPVAERVYMGSLTYVVQVPAITLAPETTAGDGRGRRAVEELTFSEVSVKIQALSPPRQGWVVSQVDGIAFPLPSSSR